MFLRDGRMCLKKKKEEDGVIGKLQEHMTVW